MDLTSVFRGRSFNSTYVSSSSKNIVKNVVDYNRWRTDEEEENEGIPFTGSRLATIWHGFNDEDSREAGPKKKSLIDEYDPNDKLGLKNFLKTRKERKPELFNEILTADDEIYLFRSYSQDTCYHDKCGNVIYIKSIDDLRIGFVLNPMIKKYRNPVVNMTRIQFLERMGWRAAELTICKTQYALNED